MRLLAFFVDKTKLVNMLTIGLLIIGIIAVSKIKREAFPKVDFDVVLVMTIYPGAAPEDVELNVTIPLEEKIQSVNGLRKVTSISREGYSMVQVEIDPDARNKEKVKSEIQKAVDQVVDLPTEVENRPVVWELKTDNFEIVQIALSSDQLSEQALRSYARRFKKKLESLPNVSNTENLGFRQREIQIQVDLDQLPNHYLSLSDIVNFIRARNVRIPAGLVRGDGETKSVVTEAKFKTLADVKNMILRTNFEGNQVRVRDVAQVKDGFEEYNELNKMNGNIGLTLGVIKKSNADILRTMDQVNEAVQAFRKTAGDKVRIDYIADVSVGTRSIIKIVTLNAVFGILLVVAMLLVFLNLRTAFWTAMGIPLALCITLFVMVLTDVSLSGNSLLGMVIVLGMLVDDAIVVAESIYRYRLEGLSAYDAAKKGLKVVALPVLVTITTTVIAFSPLFTLPGIAGKFIRPIPLVIIFTLIASLFEAYFILPNHLTGHALKRASDGKAAKQLKDREWFQALRAQYGKVLEVALSHRVILVSIFIVIFIGSMMFAVTKMKFVLFPQSTIEAGTWYLEAERETSLAKMDRLTSELEAILAQQPKGAVLSYATRIARGRWDMPESENYATLVVNYPPAAEQTYNPRTIVAALEAHLKKMPAMREWRHEVARGGPPVGGDVEIEIVGNDNQKRKTIVTEIMTYLRAIKGVTDVESSDKSGKPEVTLVFDFERLARYGLNATDVGLTVRTALEGSVVSRTYTPEERIDYRVLLRKKDREKLDTIKKLAVFNSQRVLVPITDVVKLSEQETVAKLEHLNGDRVTKITTNLDKKVITPIEVSAKLNEFAPGVLAQYPGFEFILGGEAKESQEFFVNITVAFLVAILAIYFILSLLFNSFIQPFIVMVTIPFGIVGVIWTFALHGLEFSFLTMIGVVGLSGIVVNDSLIMVDYINRLVKSKGCRTFKDYFEATVEGAKTRLRPIILTTVTTAAGVMPTAYGLGGYVESIAPMVLAIGWGILFASTLTLFLLPAFYLIEVKVEMKMAKWFPWLPLKTQCETATCQVEEA